MGFIPLLSGEKGIVFIVCDGLALVALRVHLLGYVVDAGASPQDRVRGAHFPCVHVI